MVSIHGFMEAAQHAVGVGTDSSVVKMCSQAIMPNAQSKFCSCLSSWPVWITLVLGLDILLIITTMAAAFSACIVIWAF